VSQRDPEAVSDITGVSLEAVVLDLVSESPPTAVAPLSPLAADLGEGNHLLYAIQWFSFIAIVVIGFAALLRRQLPKA
jgi:cytochrome oxidase assembly protein ShyY1